MSVPEHARFPCLYWTSHSYSFHSYNFLFLLCLLTLLHLQSWHIMRILFVWVMFVSRITPSVSELEIKTPIPNIFRRAKIVRLFLCAMFNEHSINTIWRQTHFWTHGIPNLRALTVSPYIICLRTWVQYCHVDHANGDQDSVATTICKKNQSPYII